MSDRVQRGNATKSKVRYTIVFVVTLGAALTVLVLGWSNLGVERTSLKTGPSDTASTDSDEAPSQLQDDPNLNQAQNIPINQFAPTFEDYLITLPNLPGRIADDYPRLRYEAERGDPRTAVLLFLIQGRCNQVPANSNDLDDSDHSAMMRVEYERCLYVPREMAFVEDVLTKVANAGDVTAQILLVAYIPERFDTTDIDRAHDLAAWEVQRYRWNNNLADQGFGEAFYTLGAGYMSRTSKLKENADKYPVIKEIQTDLQKALAYLYVAQRLSDNPDDINYVGEIDRVKSLLPDDAPDIARIEAREILTNLEMKLRQ